MHDYSLKFLEEINDIKLKAEIKEARRIKETGSLKYKKMPVKTKPHSYQLMAFNLGITLSYFALMMEQRTRKTLPIIGIIGHRYLNDGVKKVLIVAPSTVVYEWESQLKQHADYDFEVIVLTDTKKSKKITQSQKKMDLIEGIGKNPDKLTIILTNYESVWRIEKALKTWKPEIIVCDESQKIKSHKSQQTKALIRLGKKTKYKIALSGTMIAEGPTDIFSQFMFLTGKIFGYKFNPDFRDKYCVVRDKPWGKTIVNYRIFPTNLNGRKNRRYNRRLEEDFFNRLNSISFRITREQADEIIRKETGSEIKGKRELEREFVLTVKLEPDARKLYNEMEAESIVEVDGEDVTASIVLTKMLRLQQIAGGYLKADDSDTILRVSKNKMRGLKKLLTEIIRLKVKVVIFAKFTAEINGICRLLGIMNQDYFLLSGKTKKAERRIIMKQFQNSNKIKILVSQIRTGGVGITLDSANIVIVYSNSFSFNDYDQAKVRVCKLGEKYFIVHLIAKNTIDEEVLQSLRDKKSISQMSVGDLRKIFKK